MKHNILFLTLSYFCIAIQFCSAMENKNLPLVKQKNKNLPLVKQISSIDRNSAVKYGDSNILLAYNTNGCNTIDITKDKILQQLDTNSQKNIAINPAQTKVALIKYRSINFYDIKTGKLDTKLNFTNSSVESCYFDYENNVFISLYEFPTKQSTIQKYSYDGTYHGDIKFLHRIKFDVCGNHFLICVAQEKGLLSLYNTKNLAPYGKTLDLNCSPVSCYISPDGIAAVMHEDNTKISIVDLSKDTFTQKVISYPKDQRRFCDLIFFLKNKILAIGSTTHYLNALKPTLDYWDLATGTLISFTKLQEGSYIWDIDTEKHQTIMSIKYDTIYGIYSIDEIPTINNK